MIGKWECPGDELSQVLDWIEVDFYRLDANPGEPGFRPSRLTLKTASDALDTTKVFVYQDKKIDLVAIDVDTLVRDPNEHIHYTDIPSNFFVKFGDITKQFSGVGDQVFALGYPFGIRSVLTNHPIAKTGYFASLPGEELSVPYECGEGKDGKPKLVSAEGKILLVDGLITHGNSGGPVVLAGGTKVRHDPVTKQIEWSNVDVPNFVTGIVSSGWDGAGLSIVVSSDYILNLLNQAVAQNK